MTRLTFWTIILWHTIRAAGRQTKAHYGEKVRRYADRYFRIGRHRPIAIGYQNIRWARNWVTT